MTELSHEILKNYQVRKTAKQKQKFIALLKERFPQLQVQDGGFPKSRNLILGDVENAKVLLSAHYDTCARLPFPNFVTPKRPLLSVLYGILVAIPAFLLLVAANFLAAVLFRDPLLNYWVSLLLYLLILWIMLAGPANRHNVNDNTSGVITLLEVYEKLSGEEREKVCLIFFDNEEKGLLGSGFFRKKFKKLIKSKLLINFDCVSDGDYFLLGVSKKAQTVYGDSVSRHFPSVGGKQVLIEKLNKIYYPSDQAGFPLSVAVAALKYKKPFGYYMDRIHTKRDTVFDETNITYLAERTAQFIENM